MKEKVRKFGEFLSGMVMPNMSAFITWGLLSAIFMDKGWYPVESIAKVIEPMQRFLLPMLIAYHGGKLVYGNRGGVVGASAVLGVICASDSPMFIGAMVIGPLSGYLMKKCDELFQNVPEVCKELVDNFSAGILGLLLLIAGMLIVEPCVTSLQNILVYMMNILIQYGLLPLTSLIVEPAKILFLNSAINHGIFTPLGIDAVSEAGKSIFFLIETNPGPGLGILLAYLLCGSKKEKETVPGSIIIHFIGGIHEIYFPYVLMNPLTVIAVMIGGMSGVFINVIFDAGLVAPASPGSIIALLGMCAKDSYLGVILSVTISALVTCLIASFILKLNRKEEK